MRIIGFFLLLLFFTSCKKQITVSGRVYNPNSGEGIPNIKMYIWKTGGGIPGGEKTLFRTYTDENGYYSFSEKKMGATYLSVVLGDDYKHLTWVVNGEEKGGTFQQIVKGKNMVIDVKAAGMGKVVFDYQAINCEGETDMISRRVKYEKEDWIPSGTFSGCFAYLSDTVEMPEGTYQYELTIQRPSGNKVLLYSFFNSLQNIDTFKIHY